jgi:hypothetical protein
MTTGVTDVFLPVFREDNYQAILGVIDKEFKQKFPTFQAWQNQLASLREEYNNAKHYRVHEVQVESGQLDRYFKSKVGLNNYSELLHYAKSRAVK